MSAAASVDDLIWLQTGFIGDVVLTTAAIELAAAALPRVRQHLVTTKLGAAAIGDHPALASCVVFDKTLAGMHQVARQLAAVLPTGGAGETLLLQAHRSYRSSLLALHLRLRTGARTVTFHETSAGWLAWRRVPRVAVLHEAHRIGLLLEPLGVSRQNILTARPHLPPLPLSGTAAWQQQLAEFPGRLVGIAPGSVWGTKRWTLEGYAELAKRLLQSPDHGGLGVVLLGSAAEKPLTDAIAGILAAGGTSPGRVFNLAGQTTLADLRRVMPRLALLVGNDSSPLHFAAALRTPSVALFGATTPALGFGPLAPRSRVVELADLPCRPCSLHGPSTCPLGHFRCMRDLPVDAVQAACRDLLTVTAGP